MAVDLQVDGTDITGSGQYIKAEGGDDSSLSISTGDIGIGTESPGADLEVYKNDGTPQIYLKTDGTGTQSQIKFFDGAAEIATIRGGYTSDEYLLFETEGSERMRIDDGGNVGIGVTDPDENLEVNGNIKLTDQNNDRVWTTQKVYNVLDYGALGDGSNDDTSAIGNAITDANTAGGGIVYLPEGDFRITSSLTLQYNIQFIGAGADATIITLDNATATTAIILSFGTGADNWFNSIKDMAFASSTTKTLYIHTAIAINTLNTNIENVQVYNMNIGIYVRHAHNNFRNIDVRNCNTGVQVGNTADADWGNQNYFYGGHIQGCYNYGMRFMTATSNVVFGMTIEHCLGLNMVAGVSFDNESHSNLLNGCYLEGVNEYCLRIDSPGNRIIGCWFHQKAGGNPLNVATWSTTITLTRQRQLHLPTVDA